MRTQALAELTNYFGDAARPVQRDKDGKNHARNAAVHVATYQTLGVDTEDGDESFLTEHYPPDHFSHIVIDECHRSAWGKWSKVLKMNPGAVQIGLTATPRQLTNTEDTEAAREDRQITADNLAYFGEPVYEYEIGQAMEDGYLAAMDIKLALIDLDARGITLPEIVQRNPTDAVTGRPLSPQEIADRYDANVFERAILLPDRVKAMCRDLFEQMIANVVHRGPDGKPLGPRQKTIIFCASDRHADLVATEMNNLFAACCAAKGEERFDPYAFKCTAKAGDAETTIKDFRGSARTHFVATTVELLTAGVDVKPVRNVAFFRYVASAIQFYQMIGRGAGPAFVTRAEKLVTLEAGKDALERVRNPCDFAKLVVFDTWTINPDRYFPDENIRDPNRKNVVFSRHGRRGWLLRAMDHTHCITREGHLSRRVGDIEHWQDVRLYGLFPEFHPFMRADYIDQAVESLRGVTREQIESAVAAVPREWQLEEAVRQAVVVFLWTRLRFVADTVSQTIAETLAAATRDGDRAERLGEANGGSNMSGGAA